LNWIVSLMFKLFLIFFAYSFFIMSEIAFAEVRVIDLTEKNPNIGDNDSQVINEEVIIEEENSNIEIFTEVSKENENTLEDISNISTTEVKKFSEVWKNSNKKDLIFLFNKIEQVSSKSIRESLVNFLVYGSVPPDGIPQQEFDKYRITTLKKLGDIESAITVIESIETYEDNKEIYDLIKIEKNLTDYNLVSVCDIFNNESKFISDSYILKIKIFCSYLNNNIEEADFYNSLLLEDSKDDYFQTLYNKLTGVNNNLESIKNYNYDKESIQLYSAMMRSADLPFSIDFVDLNSPQLLKAIAISPSTDIDIRIAAAEKAYKFNSLNSESVAAIYQSVDFSSDELKNPMITIEENYKNNHQMAMALLFQSSRIQILPISRLQALSNFWNYSSSLDHSQLAYDLSMDLLDTIEPTSELIEFSIGTSMAHLYSNNIKDAKEWLKLADSNIKKENIKINNEYLKLLFLINLKEQNYEIDESLFKNLLESLEITESDINNIELYLTTLEEIGFNIPRYLWELTSVKINDDRNIPSIYAIKLINESSEKKNIGELFLNIAVSLDGYKWSKIHPYHITLIFNSLRRIDRDEIIQDLTMEILEDIG